MHLRLSLYLLILLFVAPSTTIAGFSNWSVDTESDPFSGGRQVTASYMSTIRSGAFVMCDTAKTGLEIRVVAGWEMTSEAATLLAMSSPKAAVAIDGDVLLADINATPGACGQNIACVTLKLSESEAQRLVKAMISARRQIAIKDGISDKPHLLKARGSTRSGERLKRCLDSQG